MSWMLDQAAIENWYNTMGKIRKIMAISRASRFIALHFSMSRHGIFKRRRVSPQVNCKLELNVGKPV
jgi:hypothetical protein